MHYELNKFRFSNNDGKVWVVPTRNMRVGLMLYQPSGFKGKLLKFLIPYLYWIPLIKRLIKGAIVEYHLDSEIRGIISKVLGCEDWEFSVFEGTPSVHKKPTIQIFRGKKILAYCKVSSDSDVARLFSEEAKMLDELNRLGVGNIPKALFCDRLSDGSMLFIQSTTKTMQARTVHSFRNEHWLFLEELKERTSKVCSLKDSDLGRAIARLEAQYHCLSEDSIAIVDKAIDRVKGYYGEAEHRYNAYHGDFTPWNMYYQDGKLSVFDFEYASLSYPAYFDWFHFFTQTAVFERGLEAEGIVEEFYKVVTTLNGKIREPKIEYMAYVLDIMSKYIDREKGELSEQTVVMVGRWSKIISLLCE